MIRALAVDVARFLLPNTCVACDRLGDAHATAGQQLLCSLCRSRLRPLTGGCPNCAQPLPPVGPCRFCADWADLRQVWSAVWLDERARAVVHGLKYAGLRALGDSVADVVARRVRRPRGTLVPIPLGARRQHDRGYNQAERIARALGERWALPVRADVLTRSRDTRTQTELTPEARKENVRSAFSCPATAAGLARRRSGVANTGQREGVGRIILVDDVLTTGATLVAAAAALHAAGWASVFAITFARAQPWGRRLTS